MRWRNILLFGLVIAGVFTVRSQTVTWSPDAANGVFNLGTGVNWVGGNVPAPDSDLVFGAVNTGTTSTIRLLAAFSAKSITFSGAYPAYTFSSNNGSQLSVGSGGITVGAGTNSIVFDSQLSLALTANQTWTVGGATSVAGAISGAFGITKTGSSRLTLSGTNTYTGTTSINAGTLVIGADLNLGAAPGAPTPGSLTFNGGTLNTTGQFTLAANRGIALAGAGTIETDASTILTYDGLIAGTGTLTKSGDGSLFLTGANTFSGGVDFFDGNLKLGVSSVLSGPIVSGPVGTGTLRVTASGNTLIATAAGLILHNPVNLQAFSLSASAASGNTLNLAGLIAGTGSLAKNGDSTLTLSGANTFSGGFDLNDGTLLLGASSIKSGSSITSGPLGTGTLKFTDSGATLGVTGATATLHNPVTINSATNPTVATAGTNRLTLAGLISGSGSFTKTGSGTLTLSGANLFTGGATVSAGSLLLGVSSTVLYQVDAWVITSGAFGTGQLSLAAGTTLAPVAGAGTITLYNRVVLTGNATLGTPGSTDQLRFDTKPDLASGLRGSASGRTATIAGGVVTLAASPGTGSLDTANIDTYVVNTGAGLVFAFQSALPVTGITANTGSYVGVANGILDTVPQGFLSSAYSLIAKLTPSASAFAGTFGFDSEDPLSPATYTGILDFSGFSNSGFDGISTLGSAIIGTGATLFAPSSGPNANKLAFSASNGGTLIVDTALLTARNFTGVLIGREDGRADTGSVVLSNASNNYVGGTTLKSGTLVVRSATALGTGALTATNSPTAPTSPANAPKLTTTLAGNSALGLTLANALVVNTSYASGAYGLGIGGIDNFTLSGALTGTGVIDKYGAGTLTITGDGSAFTGKTNILAGTLQIGNGGTAGSLSGNIANAAALAFNRSDALTYSGVISGSGSLLKQSAGKLTLTGQSTYTGNTTVTGGILEILTANALPTTTLLSLASGTTLDVDANQTIAGFFGASGAGATIALDAGKTFTVAMPTANTSTTFAGTVNGAGAFAVGGAGSNVVNLTGTVSHTGGTVVGSGASLVIGSGGFLTGPITTTGTLGFGATGTQTLSNLISGSGGLSVTAGTTTLTANNTFTGPSTITGGKLFITGTNTGGGSVTIGSGGTFGGTGTFSGPLFVNSGGSVAPGSSPGTLSVGATTFAGAGRFTFDINSVTGTVGTNWDLLSISGALTITATSGNPFIVDLTSLDLSNTAALVSNFNAASPYSWKFVQTTGGITGFSAGAFQYNASAFQNSLGGGSFFVSNVGNDLFLNFTPVPEPSTYALMALGLGVIVVLARRRRL